MIAINEDQIVSTAKQTFAEKKTKYLNTNEMERTLIEKGLTPKEAMKALSLARTKQEVGMLYPPKRELCYQVLTEEDRKLQNRSISAVRTVFDKKKSKYVKVDEMKQQLLEILKPEEVEQAISLAEANQVMRWCLPYVGEIHGEPSYELLTEDLKIEEEEEKELEEAEKDYQEKKRTQKKTKKGRREPADTSTQREKK